MAARRSLLAMSLLGLSLALTGCESMDPAYWIPDNKKKLSGDRREVFPEGVPGVVQGVPPELIKGNNALMDAEPAPQATAPVEEKPKPKARPRREARPAQPVAEPQPQRRAQPAQAAPRQAQQPTTGAWPSPQSQASQPQASPQPAPAASGWPAPPPSGTFAR